MAGISSNIAWLMAQKQAAKGTVATWADTKAHKNALTGGSIAPTHETDLLSETDANRDRGDAYIVTSGVEGEPEIYVRDESIAFWLYAAFGAIQTSGSSPNYTHTITPAASLPYITVWRMVGNVLWERFKDCKASSITISADAGSPLTATIGIQGLDTVRLTAAPDDADPMGAENSAVYNFNNAAVTLGGGATALVSSFELTVENNVERQQTDNVTPYDVVEGTREVSLGFDMVFDSIDEYNKFHYGGAAGTTISSEIYSSEATFTFTKGANNEIAFNLPVITYEEFPLEPDPAGGPMVVSVRAVAPRGTGTPIVTATVKNQAAGTRYGA